MPKVAIALLAAVALLLTVQIVDRWREPQQLKAVAEAGERTAQAIERQTAELKALRAELARRPTAEAATPPAAVSMPADAAGRDGNPKLGTNFLLPYDRSWYDPAKAGGTLRVFNSTPKSLNPLTDNSATSSAVHGLCNDALCDRPPQHPEQWSESLAEAVVISDDYRTYTFRLRAGVSWQRPVLAGRQEFAWLDRDVPLTAADFVFALDLIMDPTVDCPSLRTYYEDLESWKAPDDRTLVLRWKRKVYTSLSFSLGLSPLPRHVYGCNRDGSAIPRERLGVSFNKHWFDDERGVVGVGAYRLEEFTPDKIMRFRRYPGYWGAPLHFEAIEWNLEVKQDDPQLVAFKNGQVHSHGLSPLAYKSEIIDHKEPRFAAADPADPKAGRAGELGWERVKAMSFGYIGWNMRRPPFDDQRVRQAMSHAFPKERIIRDVFAGLGQPVLSDVHPDSQYCNRDLKPYAFDLQTAAALLDAAGWKDGDGDGIRDKEIAGKRMPFAFEVKYYANSPEWDNALNIFRNELKKIGVDMTLKSFEWKKLMEIYEDKDFTAMIGGWQMDWDIDYYQLWHSSQVNLQGSSNHCGFADKRVDDLAERLRTTFETPERIRIAKEIQAIIHEAQPYTFFRSGEGIFIWQNRSPAGRPVEAGRWLDGVTWGLDHLHPLVNRSRLGWHFVKP